MISNPPVTERRLFFLSGRIGTRAFTLWGVRAAPTDPEEEGALYNKLWDTAEGAFGAVHPVFAANARAALDELLGEFSKEVGSTLTLHPDSSPEALEAVGSPGTPDPEGPREVLAELTDLHSRFADGYTAEDIRAVFGRIHDAGGPCLVCVWNYWDEDGAGGDSEFYAEDEEGTFFEVQPDVYRWLSGQQATPGPVESWVCAPVAGPTEFPASDDCHNYARQDRNS
ncbi:hypothetical protein [Streptomyces sp. NPDC048442]|uniref:hypothetical protein n=1 Tax=Streptomyces sp. NPDC048442 TaxID=3154823 RepID=UPI003415EEDE